jgi:hypothetical protein
MSRVLQRFFYVVLLVLFSFANFKARGQSHVFFGERENFRNALAVYFDKDGHLYPDFFISDSSLQLAEGRLSIWYEKNPEMFKVIGQKYGCDLDTFTEAALNQLNDSIRSRVIKAINSESSGKNSVTLMVHGFRKSFHPVKGDKTSGDDFDTLRNSILKHKLLNTCFVEVYWDGNYVNFNETKGRVLSHLFGAFEEARDNSILVGKGLRMVASHLETDSLYIVAHSLGARVACMSLFDLEEFRYPTPEQNYVSIGLIAPAIDGDELIKGYYKRHTNSACLERDNYRLTIVYSTKDVVLKKRLLGVFGPGPYKHGETTLGCNHRHELDKLQAWLNTNAPATTIRTVNLSTVIWHHLRYYCKARRFYEAIDSVYQ